MLCILTQISYLPINFKLWLICFFTRLNSWEQSLVDVNVLLLTEKSVGGRYEIECHKKLWHVKQHGPLTALKKLQSSMLFTYICLRTSTMVAWFWQKYFPMMFRNKRDKNRTEEENKMVKKFWMKIYLQSDLEEPMFFFENYSTASN